MDNQRLFTWGLLLMMLWFTYVTWLEDYSETPQPVAVTEQPAEAAPADNLDTLPGLPAAPNDSDLPTVAATDSGTTEPPTAGTVTVTTDVMTVEIDLRGATLVSATMLNYPVSKNDPNQLIRLLSPRDANYGAIRTGVRNAVDSSSIYRAAADSYTLGDADSLTVTLEHVADSGLSVSKRLTFTRGSYRIDVEQQVQNGSNADWSGDFYVQLLRRSFEQERSMFDVDSFSFDGPIVFNGDTSEKLKRKDLLRGETETFNTVNGWVAAIEHHFLSAVVPTRDQEHAFQVDVRQNRMIASVVSARQQLAPSESHTFETTLFVGPKLQSQLEEIDPKLKLTVDYGFLTILSQPMFWLLSMAYDFVKNWGFAIILVTILIKLVFYKLTESSGRSMAKMRALQPRMQSLQERYKDDRQALSQAMMDLYKKEKVNPAAGCLPILIQMPFFLAFYWVLVESVEMRQAPFVLWLTDLSVRDPYFILPLIMGAAMFLQQKLNPAPADPVQARVLQVMPIVFTGFFAFFPSGLVLYWATNTILSIAQQWKINKVVAAEEQAKKTRGNKKNKKKSED